MNVKDFLEFERDEGDDIFGDLQHMNPMDHIYHPRNDHYVFVYGTMKQGFRNNGRLFGTQNSKFIGDTKTNDAAFDMFSKTTMRDYTAPFVLFGGTAYVAGELYLIDGRTLYDLDMAEGYPVIYSRKLIEVQGHHRQAWMYFFDKSMDRDNLQDVGVEYEAEDNTYQWSE